MYRRAYITGNIQTSLIILDEIGKMELYSAKFKDILNKALDTKKVVGTIMERTNAIADQIKSREDTKLLTVTFSNRNKITDTIITLL